MLSKMKDKHTILITGATGNIGGGAAVALTKRDAKIVLLGRKLENLEARKDFIHNAYLKLKLSTRIRTLPRC